jgi:hypothetical protein
MATKRGRKARHATGAEVGSLWRSYLRTGVLPDRADAPDECATRWLDVFIGSQGTAAVARACWEAVRDELLSEWIAEYPGTRPWAFWEFDAPEPRLRLGGTGTPTHEVLNVFAEFDAGVPVNWLDAFDCEYYTGRAVDVNGRPIGQEFAGNKLAGVAIDPADPPRYESEAAYLKRLDLLTPDERRRLRRADFDPVVVELESDNNGQDSPATAGR